MYNCGKQKQGKHTRMSTVYIHGVYIKLLNKFKKVEILILCDLFNEYTVFKC